jgi:hypothetical protein
MRKSGKYYCVTYLLLPLKLLSFSEMSISEKCESFQWGESFCDSAVQARLAWPPKQSRAAGAAAPEARSASSFGLETPLD